MTYDREQRAEEIRYLVGTDDVGRAANRLLDFAKDYGTRKNMDDAFLLKGRHTHVSTNITLYGESRDLEADRTKIIAGILELIHRIENSDQSAPVVGSLSLASGEGPARAAFTAGIDRSTAKKGDVVLRARDLGHVRRFSPPPFRLKGVSFELKIGEILLLVGANGQGKSTLLELLAGKLAHHEGELDYPSLDEEWSQIKRYIAYMPQSAKVTGAVSEISLRYIAGLYGSLREDNDLVVNYYLTRLGLETYRNVTGEALSRGYQVRLALARALLKRPRLLLLDEPLAHLDIPTQARFLSDLLDLCRGETNPFAVVISSQHMHEIEIISDTTLALLDGRPTFYGPTSQIGQHRKHESYELNCDREPDVIRAILSNLGDCSIAHHGGKILVRLPLGVNSVDVLKALTEHGVRISFFREVSTSAVSLLEATRS